LERGERVTSASSFRKKNLGGEKKGGLTEGSKKNLRVREVRNWEGTINSISGGEIPGLGKPSN